MVRQLAKSFYADGPGSYAPNAVERQINSFFAEINGKGVCVEVLGIQQSMMQNLGIANEFAVLVTILYQIVSER